MRVRVIAVGRLKGPVAAAAEHYRKRAQRYWRLDVREEREGKGGSQEVVRTEGLALLKGVEAGATLWVLSRDGNGWSSPEWTERLERVSMTAYPTVNVVIGGAWGLSDDVRAAADAVVSLAPVTLPHDVARMVLFEQLYRAGTILRGEPYHKGPRR